MMRTDAPEFDRLIHSENMFEPGQRVLLAVSGGADSMCLFTLMSERKEELGIELFAAHVNHGLRGEESDRDERFVSEYCAAHGVECRVGRVDVPGEAARLHLGTEECARRLRYEFLEKIAEELGCARIATAHNADDNAETVIMNLVRGAGVRGLSGIPPVRGVLVRPLLTTSRDEILAILERAGVPHVEDSTNSDTAYTRNMLRHEIIPRLRKINPALTATVAAGSAELRRDSLFLESLAEAELTDSTLSVERLRGLDPAVRSRVLRQFAKRSGAGELTLLHTEAMEKLVMSDDPAAETALPGLKLRREYGVITAENPAESFESFTLCPGESHVLPDGRKISCEAGIMNEKIHGNLNTFNIRRAIIIEKLTVRPRAEGDSITLAKRPRKSLKKLFTELKIPAKSRAAVPVIADGAGVLAVAGVGIDVRAAAEPGDEILIITVAAPGAAER